EDDNGNAFPILAAAGTFGPARKLPRVEGCLNHQIGAEFVWDAGLPAQLLERRDSDLPAAAAWLLRTGQPLGDGQFFGRTNTALRIPSAATSRNG
ncbi:MAG: hypothetical protein AB7K24_20785, partial [Gemmataceae bacterium]